MPAQQLTERLLQHDIIGGYDVSLDYPELANCMLFCVTETRTKDDIDQLVSVLKEVQA